MPQTEKISVVIPTFNRAKTLSRTLASLHAQTFHDFEIIVVDDGSSDNTEEVVAGFSGKYTEKKESLRAPQRFADKQNNELRRSRTEIAAVASGDLAMTEGSRTEIASLPSQGPLGRQSDLASRNDRLKARSAITILYLRQKNQGQGTARNLGVQHARASITLFIGDDIIAEPILLAEHIRYHEEHPETNSAVLGFIDWHPDLALTPFMRWMTNGSCILGRYGGHQFAYEKLNGKKIADYNFFYTSNISLKTSLLRRYPFDSDFRKYGWEDIELGYCLTQKEKLVMYYAPQAKAYHYHPMDESSLAPRMRQIGASAHIIQQKYPELRKVPSFSKQCVFRIISSWPILCFLDMMRKIVRSQTAHDYYYYALSKKYFLEGTHEALRQGSGQAPRSASS